MMCSRMGRWGYFAIYPTNWKRKIRAKESQFQFECIKKFPFFPPQKLCRVCTQEMENSRGLENEKEAYDWCWLYPYTWVQTTLGLINMELRIPYKIKQRMWKEILFFLESLIWFVIVHGDDVPQKRNNFFFSSASFAWFVHFFWKLFYMRKPFFFSTLNFLPNFPLLHRSSYQNIYKGC